LLIVEVGAAVGQLKFGKCEFWFLERRPVPFARFAEGFAKYDFFLSSWNLVLFRSESNAAPQEVAHRLESQAVLSVVVEEFRSQGVISRGFPLFAEYDALRPGMNLTTQMASQEGGDIPEPDGIEREIAV
jgi:hypothetical protein